MLTCQPKITFGDVRASGVRDVLVYCADGGRTSYFRHSESGNIQLNLPTKQEAASCPPGQYLRAQPLLHPARTPVPFGSGRSGWFILARRVLGPLASPRSFCSGGRT
jgi:hypothetical protein